MEADEGPPGLIPDERVGVTGDPDAAAAASAPPADASTEEGSQGGEAREERGPAGVNWPLPAGAKEATAAEAKRKAAEHYLGQRWRLAAQWYSAALRLEPKDAHSLCNRGAVSLQLPGLAQAALTDAQAALQVRPGWHLAEKVRIQALQALGAVKLAWVALCAVRERWQAEGHGDSVVSLEAELGPAFVRAHYDPMTTEDPGLSRVRVMWRPESEGGKGVQVTQPVPMLQTVLEEEPLVSHRKLYTSPGAQPTKEVTCARCMRRLLRRSEFPRSLRHLHDQVYPNGTPEWVPCPHCVRPASVKGKDVDGVCREVYCSEECREIAWANYHEALCIRDFVSKPEAMHPMTLLHQLCQTFGRTNPLVIARMYAFTHRLVQAGVPLEMAFLPFSSFISNEEPMPKDAVAVKLLQSIFKQDESILPLLTVPRFRHLNGAIERNAQTVQPVSDFHVWINDSVKKSDFDLRSVLGTTEKKLADFMASQEMLSLCSISGTAMFAVANCMNHSCAPNVQAASSTASHVVSFFALHELKAEDELLMTYVDQDLDVKQRQQQLLSRYKFTCRCFRCLAKSDE